MIIMLSNKLKKIKKRKQEKKNSRMGIKQIEEFEKIISKELDEMKSTGLLLGA
jgi:hypothetical protein